MKKFLPLFFAFYSFFLGAPARAAAPTDQDLLEAYKYAYDLYVSAHFDQAKDTFKKIAVAASNQGLSANSLYYYSQCAFRTEDFNGCLKALNILVKKWPASSAVQKGFVTRFAVAAIDEAVHLQTHWDYLRHMDGTDDEGKPLFKESIPPGLKVKRINFKFGFGLYRLLRTIQPDAPETAAAKDKLDKMLATPVSIVWADEKPVVKNKWGHPGDFLSKLTSSEKKDFSKIICDRMFYNWQTEKLPEFLDMYDDVRNSRPRYCARTRGTPPGAAPAVVGGPETPPLEDEILPFTLANVFKASGYNPYLDSFSSVVESSPTDLNL